MVGVRVKTLIKRIQYRLDLVVDLLGQAGRTMDPEPQKPDRPRPFKACGNPDARQHALKNLKEINRRTNFGGPA
ncbi:MULTISPECIES: hypothetical protein [Protofrankia]|uniref:Uncharacterized protein n=1 Tax=Candidatus Protofrankia datiscae TaxID=2716812 RepID=F8AZW4_9ACTN|nr:MULTISPECIES: hypothetical protein [Protofrankia]AEH10607.1 hypothetical protein FsymDg_3303 [Candidatus Protofrankia datiscae]